MTIWLVHIGRNNGTSPYTIFQTRAPGGLGLGFRWIFSGFSYYLLFITKERRVNKKKKKGTIDLIMTMKLAFTKLVQAPKLFHPMPRANIIHSPKAKKKMDWTVGASVKL